MTESFIIKDILFSKFSIYVVRINFVIFIKVLHLFCCYSNWSHSRLYRVWSPSGRSSTPSWTRCHNIFSQVLFVSSYPRVQNIKQCASRMEHSDHRLVLRVLLQLTCLTSPWSWNLKASILLLFSSPNAHISAAYKNTGNTSS